MADQQEVYGIRTPTRDAYLAERIEGWFDIHNAARDAIMEIETRLANEEKNARVEHIGEYMEAKNSDQRKAIVDDVLSQNESYQDDHVKLAHAKRHLERANNEISRLRALVELAKAERPCQC